MQFPACRAPPGGRAAVRARRGRIQAGQLAFEWPHPRDSLSEQLEPVRRERH